ncbi:hypothetical protein GCM10009743_25970 [Kribbella swartbergensis]
MLPASHIPVEWPAATTRNPNIEVSAKVAGNHGAILRKDFRAVADAVRESPPSTARNTEDLARRSHDPPGGGVGQASGPLRRRNFGRNFESYSRCT